MAASRQEVESICRELDPVAVRKLLSRFEDDYFERSDARTIAEHIGTLLSLSAQAPSAVMIHQPSGGVIDITVLAFDQPFAFSSITGVLAGTGFSIETSDVFTLERARSSPLGRRPPPRQTMRDPLKSAVIVDRFQGRLLGPQTDFAEWSAAVQAAIREVMLLLDREDEASSDRAKRLVNERVTRWLTARRHARPVAPELHPQLQPVDVQFEQLPRRTRLSLRGQDAPAFLYALSTALSLHGLSIHQMRIRTVDGHALDEIEFTDTKNRPLIRPDELERVKLSVLLTQQFAYFLDRAPDPFTALSRFEALAQQIIQMPQRGQWLELLSNPHTMTDLATVLGASDFLWEDFIRVHMDALLPVFRPHIEGRSFYPPAGTLPRRLEDALRDRHTLDQQQEKLNDFKDRELFLIDLDHILSSDNPDASFRLLSERLVRLAENLVAAATRLIYADLARQYGEPRDEQRRPVRHAVFGLGKLGGVALGYASDIELLFLYSDPGKTAGGQHPAISNGEFFINLASQTAKFIRAKREGIFHVDLRLRPYGDSGPLASSAIQFREYYRPGGAAHPFEKLALVRMRWIAGHPKLGFEIEQLRDRFVYEAPPMDLDAIWDIWTKMHAQHASGRQFNTKYSPGGLADLEGAVQLVQIKHAQDAPQLRTPRLHEAIEGLSRAGILSAREFEELLGSYQFIRRLINAQRMLRGSAQDLFLPLAGSDELTHLARRMSFAEAHGSDAGSSLIAEFEHHTTAVRGFIHRHFGRACPGET